MFPRPLPVFAAVLGLAVLTTTSAARAETVTGKIENLEAQSSRITLAGRVISVSATRTNICIGGICDQGMDKLKLGMTCAADLADKAGVVEARRLACR